MARYPGEHPWHPEDFDESFIHALMERIAQEMRKDARANLERAIKEIAREEHHG